MKEKIESAIRETLVIQNKESIYRAVEKIMQIIEQKGKLINRVEVIDKNGRAYVNWNINNFVETQIQDEGRTLKIFISPKL